MKTVGLPDCWRCLAAHRGCWTARIHATHAVLLLLFLILGGRLDVAATASEIFPTPPAPVMQVLRSRGPMGVRYGLPVRMPCC